MKWLYQGVMLDDVEVKNWIHFGFNLSNVNEIEFTSDLQATIPTFYKDYFDVNEVVDRLSTVFVSEVIGWLNLN